MPIPTLQFLTFYLTITGEGCVTFIRIDGNVKRCGRTRAI